MTELVSYSLPPTPVAPASSPAATIVVGWPATSEAVPPKHAEERWARWLAKGVRRDRAVRRRFQLIACIVALGLTAWLSGTL